MGIINEAIYATFGSSFIDDEMDDVNPLTAEHSNAARVESCMECRTHTPTLKEAARDLGYAALEL